MIVKAEKIFTESLFYSTSNFTSCLYCPEIYNIIQA